LNTVNLQTTISYATSGPLPQGAGPGGTVQFTFNTNTSLGTVSLPPIPATTQLPSVNNIPVNLNNIPNPPNGSITGTYSGDAVFAGCQADIFRR